MSAIHPNNIFIALWDNTEVSPLGLDKNIDDLSQKLKQALKNTYHKYPKVEALVELYTPHELSLEEGEALVKALIIRNELQRIGVSNHS